MTETCFKLTVTTYENPHPWFLIVDELPQYGVVLLQIFVKIRRPQKIQAETPLQPDTYRPLFLDLVSPRVHPAPMSMSNWFARSWDVLAADPSLPLTVLPCSGLKQTSHNWLSMYLTLKEQFHIQIPGLGSHDTNLNLKINRISSRNFPHLRNCTSHFKKKWSGSLPRLQHDPSLHC